MWYTNATKILKIETDFELEVCFAFLYLSCLHTLQLQQSVLTKMETTNKPLIFADIERRYMYKDTNVQ